MDKKLLRIREERINNQYYRKPIEERERELRITYKRVLKERVVLSSCIIVLFLFIATIKLIFLNT